ncbi:MAG TPA: protocatechuate 3,4-dioxygenase subunit beta [Roseateles sp.]
MAHPPALTPGYRSSLLRAPRQPLVALAAEAALMPAFAPLGELDHDLLLNAAQPGGSPIGERLLVHGFVRDRGGRALPGVLVEVWQANAGGRYRHDRDGYRAPLDPNFGGAGRCLTDRDGRYRFLTVKPGPYPWRNGPEDGWRPSHIHFSLTGPSWAQRLVTQMYFEGDPLIASCPILGTVPTEAGRRALIGLQDRGAFVAHDHRAYRFDLILR